MDFDRQQFDIRMKIDHNIKSSSIVDRLPSTGLVGIILYSNRWYGRVYQVSRYVYGEKGK